MLINDLLINYILNDIIEILAFPIKVQYRCKYYSVFAEMLKFHTICATLSVLCKINNLKYNLIEFSIIVNWMISNYENLKTLKKLDIR